MNWEIFAGSKAQNGRARSEDDFFISRGTFPACGIADGAGNANLAARKALTLFSKLHNDAEKTPAKLLDPEVWKGWVKVLDSSLLGGAQSTFVGLNIGDVLEGNERKTVAVGACCGDSRLYLLDRQGKLTFVTDGATKARLGSGQASAFTFKIEKLFSGDILLLLSDGAYTPMSLAELQKIVVTSAVKHLSEVPTAIIDRAGKYGGLGDDATVICARVR
jgi:serine/threonine protein phosphatase PrpC